MCTNLVDIAEDIYWGGWTVWQQLIAEPPSGEKNAIHQ